MASNRKHKPVHPGEILLKEFLEPLGITRFRLARDTGMPADRVGRLVKGTRAFTADSSLRLARYFGTSPEFWMNLQARYDLQSAARRIGPRIERRVKPLKAA
jgi:addiction module HigA family antidote